MGPSYGGISILMQLKRRQIDCNLVSSCMALCRSLLAAPQGPITVTQGTWGSNWITAVMELCHSNDSAAQVLWNSRTISYLCRSNSYRITHGADSSCHGPILNQKVFHLFFWSHCKGTKLLWSSFHGDVSPHPSLWEHWLDTETQQGMTSVFSFSFVWAYGLACVKSLDPAMQWDWQ